VQDNSWDGPLCVIRYVAMGGLEMVAECVGRDLGGSRIVRFLVVSNFRIHRRLELGVSTQHVRYPDALDSRKYVRRALPDDTLPTPGPIFPIPFYPDISLILPTYPAADSTNSLPVNSSILNPLAHVFHFMCGL
jgi:hypothetical protein